MARWRDRIEISGHVAWALMKGKTNEYTDFVTSSTDGREVIKQMTIDQAMMLAEERVKMKKYMFHNFYIGKA